jgi:hypothetical protein
MTIDRRLSTVPRDHRPPATYAQNADAAGHHARSPSSPSAGPSIEKAVRAFYPRVLKKTLSCRSARPVARTSGVFRRKRSTASPPRPPTENTLFFCSCLRQKRLYWSSVFISTRPCPSPQNLTEKEGFPEKVRRTAAHAEHFSSPSRSPPLRQRPRRPHDQILSSTRIRQLRIYNIAATTISSCATIAPLLPHRSPFDVGYNADTRR